MAWYRDASIQRKLTFVILATSLLGLSLACMAFEIYERASYRRALISELSALADTLGANTTASLAFSDHQSARDILTALRAEPHIVGSCLYDKHGDLFAEYQRNGKGAVCGKVVAESDGARFEGESVTQYRAISLGGEKAGTIAIVSDLEELHAKIRQYTLISAAVIVLSVLATFLVSSRLVRLITEPILQLAGIASRVTKEEDYGLRAVSSGNDEVGTLIASFNQMLERIQERDAALQNSNSQLEVGVQQRTQELQGEVNERMHAEEALSKERSILRALIDNVPDFMYVKDAQCRFVVANASLARSMGARRPDELLQKTDFDFFPKELAETYYRDEQSVIHSKQALFNREEESMDNEGNTTYLLTTKVPLFDRSGRSDGHCRSGPRHHRAAEGGTRDAASARSGRSGKQSQERVPGQHEPRDPDTAERRDRNDGPGAGNAAHAGTARIPGDSEELFRLATHGDQRHPGLFQDRGGKDRPGEGGLQPARFAGVDDEDGGAASG